jgi:hypothetical protein
VDFDDQGGFRIVSAKVVSGRLGSFVTTPVANPARDPWLNGNALIWGLGFGQASMTAPLLANGHLGPATPLPGDPEGVVAQAIGPTGTAVVLAAVNVGSRRVWAVNGGPDGKSLASLMVCCSAAGTPTNLTSMLLSRQAGIFPYTTALGRDGHGRLWIAWGDTKRNYSIYPQLTAHLVQLDPTTLAVIHSSTYASVLPPTSLLCSDACRLVSGGGGASVWGGSGSPVRAAASGQLLVAGGTSKLSLVTLDEKIKGQPDQGGFRVVLHEGLRPERASVSSRPSTVRRRTPSARPTPSIPWCRLPWASRRSAPWSSSSSTVTTGTGHGCIRSSYADDSQRSSARTSGVVHVTDGPTPTVEE